MAKNKKAKKEKFTQFMSIFIIILLLGGILLPAIVVMIDLFVGK